jgi:addiction module HigA family antidote
MEDRHVTTPIKPIHPGKFLFELVAAHKLTTRDLIKHVGHRATAVLECRVKVTVDLAYRLGRLFDNGAIYWMDLQRDYEAAKFEQNIDAMFEIRNIVPLPPPPDK